ncbi:cupin domain-containing protein [Collimonas humicola]|uniref:cupin domain-containing protein n=1 Tax=Collimonas humicola TaxID=2825886 RepID=UPI001B8BD8A2|nr:cupin domain-containing protein [Collimonas humicola]
MARPECIKHWQEIQGADDSRYPGSAELMSIGSPFGRSFGLKRIGIHHEVLPPGRRTSWPHAEKTEEEFAYVIEGTPDVWLDGHLHRLAPGDGVGFATGTGLAHTFINNTETDVRLLVVGECFRADNQVIYPLHPARNAAIGSQYWSDAPQDPLGPHDGLPDKLRQSNGPF